MSLTLHELDVIQAARLLYDKLEVVQQSPEYRLVWASYHKHGGVYEGPDFNVEMSNLKSAIGAMDLHPAPAAPVKALPSDQPVVRTPEPYPIRIHASGGDNGVHDYRMSDGSVRTLMESEAEELVLQSKAASGIVPIEGYKISWQKGPRRVSKIIEDHGEAMEYYEWRSSSSNNEPVLIEALIVPIRVTA